MSGWTDSTLARYLGSAVPQLLALVLGLHAGADLNIAAGFDPLNV